MEQHRLPPQNIEAEMSILGAVLFDPECLDDLQGLITAEQFYRNAHSIIFKAMCYMRNNGTPIDLVSMTTVLRDSGTIDEQLTLFLNRSMIDTPTRHALIFLAVSSATEDFSKDLNSSYPLLKRKSCLGD